MLSLKDYEGQKSAWCPGCGNFGILTALKKALVALGKKPHEVLVVSGIGQASKLPHYMRCNTFDGLHGRTLPPATGAKIANRELLMIALGGDGDCYGEGGNHLIHAIRRNVDITLLVHNNHVYGLTKGQASPTSQRGFVTKVQKGGVILNPLNPIAMAVALDAGFVGRGFSGDIDFLSELIQKAVLHKGFSLVDILQPCVTFNKVNTYQWYKERVYKIEEEEKNYNPEDRARAFERALEWGERIPVGVIFKKEKPTFEEQIPALKEGVLIDKEVDRDKIKNFFEELM